MFKSCSKCGGDNKYVYDMVTKNIKVPNVIGEIEIVIKDVPTFRCDSCGDKYRFPFVDEKIEEIVDFEYKRISRYPESYPESISKDLNPNKKYSLTFNYSDL